MSVSSDNCDGDHSQPSRLLTIWTVHCSILLSDCYVLTSSPKSKEPPLPAPYKVPSYGSDVMVDAMRAFKFPYLSLNPGSSFRGLHDSLVNYADDEMTIIEC